jgi:hypothetical protein
MATLRTQTRFTVPPGNQAVRAKLRSANSSSIFPQLAATFHREAAFCSPLFEPALVLVRLDHVTSIIVNANHSIM